MAKKMCAYILLLLSIIISIRAYAENGFINNVKGVQLKSACTNMLKILEHKELDPSDAVVGLALDSAICTSYLTAVNDTVYMMSAISSGSVKNKNLPIRMPYCDAVLVDYVDYH